MHALREGGYLKLLVQLAREDLEGAAPEALAAIAELTGARAVGLDVTDVRSSELVLRAHAGSSGEAVSLELVVVPVSAGGLRGVISASFAATHPPGAADVA